MRELDCLLGHYSTIHCVYRRSRSSRRPVDAVLAVGQDLKVLIRYDINETNLENVGNHTLRLHYYEN